MKNGLYFLTFLIVSISGSSCTSEEMEDPNLINKKEIINYSILKARSKTKDSIDPNFNQNKESSADGDPLNPRPPR